MTITEERKVDTASTVATVRGGELVRILTNVLPHVSKGDSLPVLECVRLECDEHTVTAVATDRYTLALDACQIPAERPVSASWSLTIEADACKQMVNTVKPWLRNVPQIEVKLERTETGLTLDAYDSKIHVVDQGHEFPKYRSLLPEDEPTGAPAVGLNPSLLKRWTTVSDGTSRKPAALRFAFYGATKPVKITMVGLDSFIGIHMPVRLAS